MTVLKTNKKTYVWNNKNKLLYTYEYITGGKTGYTINAKRTLVTSFSKDNMNLVIVTLNDPDHPKGPVKYYLVRQFDLAYQTGLYDEHNCTLASFNNFVFKGEAYTDEEMRERYHQGACEVVDGGYVDNVENAFAAVQKLKKEDVDLLFIILSTYVRVYYSLAPI